MRVLLLFLLLIGSVPGAYAQDRAPLAPGSHHHVVNNVRLSYKVAGRTNGTPVVYLHGGPGQGSQAFAAVVGRQLERSLRMVYLDQRGSGLSERPWTNAYSIELLVEDLEVLRRAWKAPRIALIGHSFGTVVALEYAARYPHRVDSMVLSAAVPDLPAALDLQCARLEASDPAAYSRAVAAVTEGRGQRCNPFEAYDGPAAKEAIERNMFPDPQALRRLQEVETASGVRNTGELTRAIFNAGLIGYRFEQPDRLTMPVLLLAGEEDYQAMAAPQRDFAQRLRNGHYLEYSGAGHFMWIESPDRFAEDVARFINSPPRRRR